MIFAHKTKSDDVLFRPEEFTSGRTVWVAKGPDIITNERDRFICTGNGTEVVTVEEYRRRKRALNQKKAKKRRERVSTMSRWMLHPSYN